jgi:hypothetical protein
MYRRNNIVNFCGMNAVHDKNVHCASFFANKELKNIKVCQN